MSFLDLPPSAYCDSHRYDKVNYSIPHPNTKAHYKKPVFFVMFKMTQETVQKNRDDVHKTPPKIRSTETCKKLGKNCTQHGQCLPWRARANIPVYGSCYPHVWKLTCPRLPTNISMLFTTSRSFWRSSTFLFRKCWCPAKRLRFLVTSQKTRVSYSGKSDIHWFSYDFGRACSLISLLDT